jgi:phosphate transport system permease protein
MEVAANESEIARAMVDIGIETNVGRDRLPNRKHDSALSSLRRPVGANLEKKFRWSEFLAEKLITATAFASFAFIVLIFVFVFRETLPIFSTPDNSVGATVSGEVQETYGDEPSTAAAPAPSQRKSVDESEGSASFKNLASTTWQPVSQNPKFGLLPLVVGSFKVSMISVLIAGPIAILAALFTAMFAPRWAKEILKPAIEVLAGFPSVVIGFFALIVLATVLQEFFGFEYRLNAFVGGVALSLAVIPIIFTIAEDALASVPKSLTEASLALGATRWQTALFVVLPAATPGIFAALLLGVGRAFGETMIVLMATGNAAMLTAGLFEPIRTMSATIGAEMAEVVFGDTHYNVLFFIGSILFAFTFTLNAVAEFLVRQRLMKRFSGA